MSFGVEIRKPLTREEAVRLLQKVAYHIAEDFSGGDALYDLHGDQVGLWWGEFEKGEE